MAISKYINTVGDNDKMSKILENICKYTVGVLWGVITIYLTILSIFGTSVHGLRNIAAPNDEPVLSAYVFYLPDNAWKNILFILVFIFVCLFAKGIFTHFSSFLKENLSFINNDKILEKTLLFLYLTIGIYYVWSTQLYPISDPLKLQVIAQEILQKDFHQFQFGEYMHRYPFQSGYILLLCAFIKLFGEKEILAIQLLNVISVCISYWSIKKISELFWEKHTWKILMAEICFLPMLLYTSLIYGNLPGFACSIMAVYLELKWFRDRKFLYAIFSAVFISIGIILKSNSLIIFCAIIIYAFFQLLSAKNKKKTALYILMLILCYMAGSHLVQWGMESLSGQELLQGMPKSTWIAMGLEDVPDATAPGFWTGYSVDIWRENGCDYARSNTAAWQIILKRVHAYMEDWRYTLNVFGRKIAAQWNEPTFQCTLGSRNSMVSLPKWFSLIYGTKGLRILSEFMDLMQTWIYFGCFLYFIFHFRHCRFEELILAMVTLGGFIFHLFWEAKSQYVMIYCLLMIPYAVKGYEKLIEIITVSVARIKNHKQQIHVKPLTGIAACIGLILIMCLASALIIRISNTKTIQYTLGVRSPDELIQEYEDSLK